MYSGQIGRGTMYHHVHLVSTRHLILRPTIFTTISRTERLFAHEKLLDWPSQVDLDVIDAQSLVETELQHGMIQTTTKRLRML
jgi:hypothetical protein